MFNKNHISIIVRVILGVVLLVGMFGVMSERVSADIVEGSLSGTVYETDGNTPIANIFVNISGNGYGASTCTDASGQFSFSGLPLEIAFRMQASPIWANCGSWSNYVPEFWQETRDQNSATLLTLDAQNPDLTNIDFTLEAGGVISGTVYASDGVTPLQNIAVSFHDEYNDYNQSVCTNENGDYEFHGVPFDMPLRVSTYAYHDNWCNAEGNYVAEFWEESPNSINATVISVTEISSIQAGIDFTVELAGSISGTIYEVDGVTPIPDMAVTIFGNNYFGERPLTDSLGNYTIHNVPLGLPVYLYAGDASLCDGGSSHAVVFWPQASSLENASLLTASGQTPDLAGIDLTLDAVPCASSNPWMRVWYTTDMVEADEWPADITLRLEIEDMTTLASPDFLTEAVLSENFTGFNLDGQFDIQPGMFVVLSGVSMSRIVKVDNLTITNIDQGLDTITGTTAPTNWLWMWVNSPACCRSTVADGNGNWIFDYSVPGPNGEPIVDISPGSQGAIHVPSGDGSTSIEWSIPLKTLHVVPAHPEIHGHDWPSGADVTLTIDNDADSGNGVLYTETKNADDEPLWCGYPCFDLNGLFTLQAGQYVTLADGINTKTVHVSPLTVTGIDMAADTISGTADPGSRVAVNIWSQNGIARYVTAAGDGSWMADFSMVGDEDFEQELADIQPDDHGRAIQLNPDGTDDGTLEYWNLSPLVTSITRTNINPTTADSINFTVTFSESVTGVTTGDFVLSKTGITGAAISAVNGSGAIYTVSVNTGSGNGTIRLDLVDDNTIIDATGASLGGAGIGDGNFTNGEVYNVVKSKPGIPVLLSPANGDLLNTLQPTLDWKDSRPAAHHYQIQVSTNNAFTALVINETDILTSDFTLVSDLDPGKRYFWRVRAFNILDGTRGWSEIWIFKTPLPQPSLVSPPNGSSLTTNRPNFTWTSINGAANYVIQVSASNSFGTLLVNATINEPEYNLPTDLPQNKTLYWRVRAKNTVVTSPWSAIHSFTTGNPPSVPALLKPANNALVKNYTPLFDWSNSALPTGTTFLRYELEVDEDNDFSSPVLQESLTDSTFTPISDLNPNTEYFWRVRAVNEVGGVEHVSSWSAVWSFRAAMLPPTLLLPLDQSTETTRKPVFDWEDVDGATSYTIQIAVGSNFGTQLWLSTRKNVSTFTPGTNLPRNTLIRWRVRANGPNGPSDWSTVFTFTTPN